MRTINRSIVEKACEDANVELNDSYSGRGMFGKKCFAIVSPNLSRFCKFLMYISDNLDSKHTAIELVNCIKYDQFGYDIIYYFPNWELTDKDDDDE